MAETNGVAFPTCTHCGRQHRRRYIEASGPTWAIYTCWYCTTVDFFRQAPPASDVATCSADARAEDAP